MCFLEPTVDYPLYTKNGSGGSQMTIYCAGLQHWRTCRIALTVETQRGDVGLVHVGPVSRNWVETLEGIEREDLRVMSTALFGGYEGAGPAGAPVEGVRALVTGQLPGVYHSVN